MTQKQAPNGFKASAHLTGGTPGRLSEFTIASGYADDLLLGDAVKSDGNGGIAKAAAGDAILGIFQGCRFARPDGSPEILGYWPGGQTVQTGTAAYATVLDDPSQKYIVQSSGVIDDADVGQLVDLDASNAGVLAHTTSGMAVTEAATDGTQFRIMKVLRMSERNVEGYPEVTGPGEFAWVEVMIAKHEYNEAQTPAASTEV